MKKLKKVLLVCLFSFIFLGFTNVNAVSWNLDSTDYSNLFSSFIKNNSSWNKESILNQCDVLMSKYMSTSYKYYTCSFILVETSSSSGSYSYNGKYYRPVFNLYQYKEDASLLYYFNSNSTYYQIYVTNSEVIARDRKIWLNLDFSVKQADSANTSVHSSTDYYKINGSIGVFQSNMMIFSAIVKSNLSKQYLTFSGNSSYSSNNFKLNDKYIGPSYNGGKVLFTDLYPSSYVDFFLGKPLNDKGTYNNSNVITYKINDEKVGNNKELKIKFTFLNQLDVNANDISIYKYGSQVLTEYLGTTCVNENNDSVCEFNLKYNVYSSNTDKLMFDFKFNNSYNVKIEDNIDASGVYSNYKDVEFEYKLLDFSKISGAIFYLRNYDNFDYMSEFLNPFEYAFGIWPCKDYGSFKGSITYGNDIRYKNTYLYKDNNNVFQYNFENYKTINNIGMDNYLFEFDSSLLDENKYSAFVIENINYLGSLDTDNLPLYVYYNSSLFNYNKLNYSTNVNNGSTNSYISSGSDFNLIINGSQQTITGGVNSGHIFEFDEEIKVQYKSGLQYFKDKIIDMFEFVSEFYNTMPEKFRVAFSLIFVLLIGIALFRLLL